MVSKRPGNSRNDQSGRSSGRTSKANDGQKKSSSFKTKASSGPSSGGNKPSGRRYESDRPGDKRSFSSPEGKSYPKKRFDTDAKESFGDKPAYNRSRKNTEGASEDKKPFTSKPRPYTGRASDNDGRPAKRTYGSSEEKKPFAPKARPYTGRAADSDERPARKPDFGRSPAPSAGKPFASRGKAPSKPFGKRDDDSRPADRPYGAKPAFRKQHDAPAAPAKTLRSRKKTEEIADDGLIRLNRYISNAGICSRRKADDLIAAGVISVNGEVVSELGHKIDPMKDVIRYNGETLRREKNVYVLLNKPKDYITTTEDPQERRTVMHLVEKASRERIYPIGRLDRNTTGLLLMTNDGELADKLSHPRNNIVKLYQAELSKSLTQGDLNKIAFGLELEDGFVKPDAVSYVSGGTKKEIGIQIHSGKNRIVRRIFEHLGYEVVKLDRVVYANLTKKDLPRGRWRYLDEKEVIQLKHLV